MRPARLPVVSEDTRAVDIAVVGAGITGLSIAYHLGMAGFTRVAIYERETIGSGASGIAPGGVRRQWSTPVSCAMSDDSFRFYRTMNQALEPEQPAIFRECGYLFLAHSMEAQTELASEVEVQRRFSIPSRMIEARDVVRIVPGLVVDSVLAASFCAEDGFFDDPWSVIVAFAGAARRQGVPVIRGRVAGLKPDGSGWRLAFARGGDVLADQVVIAAGSDSVDLLAAFGIELPIRPEPRHLFFSDPVADRICDPLVVSNEKQFAVKQLSDGQFLTSYLTAGREGSAGTPEAWKAHIAELASELLPALLDVRLTHLVKGYYDMTPDHQPIVGLVPGLNGMWVAAGLSGHGFMMAPAIGRAVASLIGDGEPEWYVRELSPARFGNGTLTAEARVI
jgi:sarcosine oxidase subunit beta